MLFVQFSRCNFVYGFEEFSDLQCYPEMCKGLSFSPSRLLHFFFFFFLNQYQMGTCIISAVQMVFILCFEGTPRKINCIDLPVLIPQPGTMK